MTLIIQIVIIQTSSIEGVQILGYLSAVSATHLITFVDTQIKQRSE